MKVLTLTQPWATLVAIGAKKIETRSWSTRYRGPLLIHAAKGLGPVGGRKGLVRVLCGQHFQDTLGPIYGRGVMNIDALPRGAIIGKVELDNCWPIVDDGEYQTVVSDGDWSFNHWHTVSAQERAFGDYTPGRYAWLLDNVQALSEPIPAKGQLGLWEFEVPTQLPTQPANTSY